MDRGNDADYTTKDLSRHTWPDFDDLFSRGSGWDSCSCMAFQVDRQAAPTGLRTRAARKPFYRSQKRQLVERDRAHGILVYAGREAIGRCQYGPVEELTLDTSRRRDDAWPGDTGAQWRITCFVTDKRYRGRGVASIALRAAVDAIRRRGGGVVEASPIAFCRSNAAEARVAQLEVAGAGIVNAAHGTFGNVSTHGTMAMFEAAGFAPVAIHRRTRVIMHLEV